MSTKQRLPARPTGATRGQDERAADDEAPPVYRIDPVDLDQTRIDLSITPEARADMEANKRLLALTSDRELLRHALSLQKWAVSVIRSGKRVFVTDAEGRVEAEMRVEPVHRPEHQEIVFDLKPRR